MTLKLEHGTDMEFDFPMVSSGKSGIGFYAYFANSSAMRKYYNNGHIMAFNVNEDLIIDLTTKNNYTHAKAYLENILQKKISKTVFQNSGILLTSFIQKFYPNAKGYINFHFGYGLPTSKEILIFDTSIIQNISWK
jgi:hypothetical protein